MRAAVVALIVVGSLVAGAPAAHAAQWCGTDSVATDRLPEAVSSNQIHVVYAIPSDGLDRFAEFASGIVTDLAAIDAWWRGQDPTRAPRFDLFAFPGCPPGLGNLDLARVQLARDSATYSPLENRYFRVTADLTRPPSAFNSPFKKYLVYYDGPVDDAEVCGASPVRPLSGGPIAYSLIFLASACPQDLGSGSISAAVVAHELTHNLGALVFPGPPNSCPQDAGHTCQSESDLMFPFLRTGLAGSVLDVNRDDYYGHSGSWWDVQDSAWLTHLDAPQHQLSVSLAGTTGAGGVKSDRPGIDCPAACAIPWDQGTAVTLVAEARPGARFVGWSGACRGRGDCDLVVDAAKAVGARFARQVLLRVQVVRRSGAAGSVVSTPAGIDCPFACTRDFDEGVRIVLRARPGQRSRFAGWSGACSGTRSCTIRLNSSRSVRAVFRRR